jgi:hypothetical protein
MLVLSTLIATPVFADNAGPNVLVNRADQGDFFEKYNTNLHDSSRLNSAKNDDWNTFLNIVIPDQASQSFESSKLCTLVAPEFNN